jgi:hypothetical protein
MKLPNLDQVIELQRGEAGRLWWAIADKCRRVVALPALHRVAKRLQTLDNRELAVVGVPPKKPRKFRLHYDELVAIMLYVFTEPISGARVPLGKIQQKSLNLADVIKF